jgi:hypothetical protein
MDKQSKLEHFFYETKLWKIWLVGFIIAFSIIYTLTYVGTGSVKGLQWVAVIGLPMLFSLIIPSMLGLSRAFKFYRKCDEMEERIKNGDDEREVFEELIKLDKEAFHVTMGGRIRELGKMFEMKYGTKILKL